MFIRLHCTLLPKFPVHILPGMLNHLESGSSDLILEKLRGWKSDIIKHLDLSLCRYAWYSITLICHVFYSLATAATDSPLLLGKLGPLDCVEM